MFVMLSDQNTANDGDSVLPSANNSQNIILRESRKSRWGHLLERDRWKKKILVVIENIFLEVYITDSQCKYWKVVEQSTAEGLTMFFDETRFASGDRSLAIGPERGQ